MQCENHGLEARTQYWSKILTSSTQKKPENGNAATKYQETIITLVTISILSKRRDLQVVGERRTEVMTVKVSTCRQVHEANRLTTLHWLPASKIYVVWQIDEVKCDRFIGEEHLNGQLLPNQQQED